MKNYSNYITGWTIITVSSDQQIKSAEIMSKVKKWVIEASCKYLLELQG